MGRNTHPRVVFLAFVIILLASVLCAEAQVFSDDFSVDSRSQYTVVNTWTQSGVGQFLYDATSKRLRLLVGDNIGLEFGRSLPAADQGAFHLDFLPTKKYPNGGTFTLRLMEDADSYYEVYNTDGYGPGGVYKYVNGQLVASAAFASSYVQNTGYRVEVSFGAAGVAVQAFGNVVSLSHGSAPLTVNRFTLEMRQQDAYVDNLFCTTAAGDLAPNADAGTDQTVTGGEAFVLDGSGSSDADGAIVSYEWRQIGIPGVFSGQAISFTAPAVSVSQVLQFELTVKDDQGAIDTDTMSVTVLPAASAVFSDDFSVDSRSRYTVVNTWTQSGVGKFLYDATGKRLRLLVGDNMGLEFGRSLPAADQGAFHLDFLPTKKYPNWGTFKLRLIEDADSYYEVYNTDGYVRGGVYKYVNGQLVASAAFTSSYVQNTGYRVGVSFSTTGVVVQAFGNVVALNGGSPAIRVSRFTLELRQQDAYVDNLGYSDDPLSSMVALGDSITKGSKDSILSDGIGYPAVLERLLAALSGAPRIVFNEGISGHTSADGVLRVAALLNKHVYPRAFLVQYGSNDAQIPIPSGLGLTSGAPGYAGSFKDNMQRIILHLIAAGKSPYLAKVPFSLGTYAYLRPYLLEYNDVVDELAAENGIEVVPPDFYCFFEAATTQIADGLHPNGLGYQSMARLWRDTLAGQYGGCN